MKKTNNNGALKYVSIGKMGKDSQDANNGALKYVSIGKMGKDSQDALAVFGGIIAGRFATKQLDKVFTSTTVQGLVGVEVAETTAKYLKPAIVGLGGLAVHQIGKGTKNRIVKMVGLGVAAVGIADIGSAVMNKQLLSGLGENNDDEYDDEYKVVDLETGLTIEGTELPELPDLNEDNYVEFEEMQGLGYAQEEFEIAS